MQKGGNASNTATSWMDDSAVDELLSAVNMRVQAMPTADAVDLYEFLLQAIWQDMMHTLGASAMQMIMQRAVELTGIEHPIVLMIEFDEDGISFERLRSCLDANSLTPTELQDGLHELIAKLLHLLVSLTGDALTARLHAAIGNGNHPYNS